MSFTESVVARFRQASWLDAVPESNDRNLAVLELLVLAAYADHVDAPTELRLLSELSETMPWNPPLDAASGLEAARDSVAAAAARPHGRAELFESICVRFDDRDAQQFILTEVAELSGADGHLSIDEMGFIDALRARFGIHR